jgi:hypothetical protein
MPSKRSFRPPQTAQKTVECVWRHWIGPGAPLDAPVDLLVAPTRCPGVGEHRAGASAACSAYRSRD